jgi:arylsulfatase
MARISRLLFILLLAGYTVHAAKQPNILVILTDDMGYSDLGCMGSEIQTPHLDALAAAGTRFTQFYNTARCCPTRASLLTGLHPHAAGMGHMGEKTAYEGYTGSIHSRCVTIAEAIKPAGYRTYAVGKWHVTHPYGPNGPTIHYPLQRGFDKYYGTITGAGSYYDPTTLCRGNTFITVENDPEYKPASFYYTDALTDNAIRFLQQHRSESTDKPFFMYLAFTAAHWPLHAKPTDIAKYKGKYDAGYDAVRQAREARMRKLGLLSPQWKRTATVGNWGKVEDKAWEARCMETYAAMVDSMDQGVGRIVADLKASGQLDNTLILYLQDNGACAETIGRKASQEPKNLTPRDKDWLQPKIWPPMQTRDGRAVRSGPEVLAGADDTYLSYGEAWANVSNTPYREYKHWVHEGGIATPLIAHWPEGMKSATKGRLVAEPGQLPDIMATCLDIAGATYPQTYNGNTLHPMAGKSLKPLLIADNAKLEERLLFWEHEGNRAVREGKWKLVAKGPAAAWELYDMEEDRTELNDRAATDHARVKRMAEAWEKWALENKVLPWPWKPAYAGNP